MNLRQYNRKLAISRGVVKNPLLTGQTRIPNPYMPMRLKPVRIYNAPGHQQHIEIASYDVGAGTSARSRGFTTITLPPTTSTIHLTANGRLRPGRPRTKRCR